MNPLMLLLMLGLAARQAQRPQTGRPGNAPSAQGSHGVTQGHMGILGPAAAARAQVRKPAQRITAPVVRRPGAPGPATGPVSPVMALLAKRTGPVGNTARPLGSAS